MDPERDVLELPSGDLLSLAEITFEFTRGGGPGGQNVNKVNSRATLRFNLVNSESLSEATRSRLLERLQPRLTNDGELVIHASEYREQARNRGAALLRLEKILVEALQRKKKRKKTRPTRGSVERRIQEGKRRSQIKKWRRKPDDRD